MFRPPAGAGGERGTVTRWLRPIARHPIPVLLAVGVLTALALLGLVDPRSGALRLAVNPAVDSLLPSSGPDLALYERARLQFGSDDTIVIALGVQDVFTPEVLSAVVRMTERMAAVDGVYNVLSLSSALNVRSVDGDVEVAPFVDEVPSDAEALARLRREALANPIYAGTLVSRDARTTALLVQLERLGGREVVARGIDTEIAGIAQAEAGDAEVWISGSPHVETVISRTILRDLSIVLPAVVGILAVVLFVAFRTARAVCLPLATIGIAEVWTLGTLGWLGRELNLVATIVPPLILTIGFSYAMHVVAEYYAWLGRSAPDASGAPRPLVEGVLGEVGVPVLVTGLTTAAGFLALGVSPILAIREFGWFSVLGVLYTVAAALTFTPAVLALLPRPARLPARAEGARLQRLAERLGDFATRRRTLVISAGVVALAVALAGTTRIRVASHFVTNFPEHAPVRVAAEAINARLGGANEIQVLVESDVPDAFLEPANLRQLDALQEWLRAQPEVGEAISVVDYVKMLYRALQDDDPAFFVIPERKSLVTQLFFFGASPETARLVDARHQFVKVHVRARSTDSQQTGSLVARIEARLAELPQHLRGHVTGSLVLLDRSLDEVARGQWTSLLLAFGVIYLVLAVLFTSFRMGLRALFPNVLPIAVYFGTLGLTGVTLNPWTSLVGCLALGIAVDDTIHYFARFNSDAKRLADERSATLSALRGLIRPVTFTSVGLCAGFLVLWTSELRSQAEFGVLAAFTLGVAWLTDVTLTPALCAGSRIVTLWDLLTLDLGPEPQRSIPLFAGLSQRQARVFALMSDIRTVPAGATLFREGDKGRTLYVILDGTLRSSLQRGSGRIELATMTRGDSFGEIGLFSENRTADVDALGDTRVIAFDPDDLERLRRRYPRIAAHVFLNLNRIQAERLVRTTRRVR